MRGTSRRNNGELAPLSSLTLATELEEALRTYPGAVIITSHDRWLRQHWTTDRAEIRNRTLVQHSKNPKP